jgi:phenylalanyl-tRNA synthetase alpha subunit
LWLISLISAQSIDKQELNNYKGVRKLFLNLKKMINYKLIDDNIKYYEKWGFKRIEVPWLVSEAVDNITKPKDRVSYQIKHNNKCLVASGEQSFLYLYLKEFLPKGRFQAVTPCFRSENFDFLHSKYFIKNELIITDNVSEKELNILIENALYFYRMFIPSAEVVKTDIGYDIMVDGHELGSYGIRKCEFLEWIYGTGCAEPRLSNLIKLYGISYQKD